MTDHICGSLSWFTSHRAIKAIVVKLPNGNTANAIISGFIHLTDSIEFRDMLYT